MSGVRWRTRPFPGAAGQRCEAAQIGRGALQKEGEQPARGADFLCWIGEAFGVIPEHFADGGAGVPAGEAVVGDVCDAVGREVAVDDVENFLLHERRNPGIDAVGEDVIELAEIIVDVGDGEVAEIDVGDFQRFDDGFAVCDLARGKIDADELRLRRGECHGNDVAAAGAAEFQDAAVVWVARRHAEESGDGGEAIGARLREGADRVGDLVVGVDELDVVARADLFIRGTMVRVFPGRSFPFRRGWGRWLSIFGLAS